MTYVTVELPETVYSVLQRQVEQIQQLPRAKQRFVIDMLNTVIQQAG